eukprot:387411_1
MNYLSSFLNWSDEPPNRTNHPPNYPPNNECNTYSEPNDEQQQQQQQYTSPLSSLAKIEPDEDSQSQHSLLSALWGSSSSQLLHKKQSPKLSANTFININNTYNNNTYSQSQQIQNYNLPSITCQQQINNIMPPSYPSTINVTASPPPIMIGNNNYNDINYSKKQIKFTPKYKKKRIHNSSPYESIDNKSPQLSANSSNHSTNATYDTNHSTTFKLNIRKLYGWFIDGKRIRTPNDILNVILNDDNNTNLQHRFQSWMNIAINISYCFNSLISKYKILPHKILLETIEYIRVEANQCENTDNSSWFTWSDLQKEQYIKVINKNQRHNKLKNRNKMDTDENDIKTEENISCQPSELIKSLSEQTFLFPSHVFLGNLDLLSVANACLKNDKSMSAIFYCHLWAMYTYG